MKRSKLVRSTHTRRQPTLVKQPLVRFGPVLFLIGVMLLAVWGIHKTLYFRSLLLARDLASALPFHAAYTTQVTHIRVGKRIDTAVVASGYVKGNWIVSPDNANHVAGSNIPGSAGNIIIYAHNTETLFGPLRKVKKGESIELTTSDGKRHEYAVTAIMEVDPTFTSPLKPTLAEVLTLYTCSGFLDSKRFVVQAVPRILTR